MRIQGWQSELNQYLLDVQAKYIDSGIVWGELDCVHYIGDWVLRCTGEDPITKYRSTYTSKDEAFMLLSTHEGSLLEALRVRFNEVPPSLAQRGDIAFLEDINALGIFFTSGARMQALFLGIKGFALHRAKDCTHAFRIE